MQGRGVRSLVWEDPACRRATKSAPQLLSPWSRARALPREKPPREVPLCAAAAESEGGSLCPTVRSPRVATKTQCSQDRLERRRKVHDSSPSPGSNILTPWVCLSRLCLWFLALQVNFTSFGSPFPVLCLESLSFKAVACYKLLED